jgi:hypothetical protein
MAAFAGAGVVAIYEAPRLRVVAELCGPRWNARLVVRFLCTIRAWSRLAARSCDHARRTISAARRCGSRGGGASSSLARRGRRSSCVAHAPSTWAFVFGACRATCAAAGATSRAIDGSMLPLAIVVTVSASMAGIDEVMLSITSGRSG